MTVGADRPADEGLESLEDRIGHRFANKSLLITALTHSTFANEVKGALSNERMEFLGDSVLSFVSAQYLYAHYNQDEGALSRMRSILVSEKSLYLVAKEYDLPQYMRLGGSLKADISRDGHVSQSVLADCVEALIAAVLLDSGTDAAQAVTTGMLRFLIDDMAVLDNSDNKDYKSLLQEHVQKRTHALPEYRSVRVGGGSGGDEFETSLYISGKFICKYVCSSAKKGQRECARAAYKMIISNSKAF